IKNNFDDVFKNIYVYINRLVKDNKLVQFIKGIYYKPLKGVFGNKLLNINKVIDKKYIHDGTRQKGYLTGAYLFNKIGLTTQIPKEMLIVTNECPNANDYNNKNLGVTIRRPKIEINDDNYKYLQLFDVLINKDNIKIEVDNEKEIIYKFIKDNELEIEKIFEYANKINNLKPIKRLYELGGVNIE
ncbi:MAG: hypothetical protein IJB71_02050, partial [Bacilli bacterium]|nr:hypothetical protein [Bacilli bacterium]